LCYLKVKFNKVISEFLVLVHLFLNDQKQQVGVSDGKEGSENSVIMFAQPAYKTLNESRKQILQLPNSPLNLLHALARFYHLGYGGHEPITVGGLYQCLPVPVACP